MFSNRIKTIERNTNLKKNKPVIEFVWCTPHEDEAALKKKEQSRIEQLKKQHGKNFAPENYKFIFVAWQNLKKGLTISTTIH